MKIKQRYFVVTGYLLAAVIIFFVIEKIIQHSIDQLQLKSVFEIIIVTAAKTSQLIVTYLAVMTALSVAGFLTFKYVIKKNELRIGFKITNAICAVVLVVIIILWIIYS